MKLQTLLGEFKAITLPIYEKHLQKVPATPFVPVLGYAEFKKDLTENKLPLEEIFKKHEVYAQIKAGIPIENQNDYFEEYKVEQDKFIREFEYETIPVDLIFERAIKQLTAKEQTVIGFMLEETSLIKVTNTLYS